MIKNLEKQTEIAKILDGIKPERKKKVGPDTATSNKKTIVDDILKIHRAGIILTKFFRFSSVKQISYVSNVPEHRVRRRLTRTYLITCSMKKKFKGLKKIGGGKIYILLPPLRGRPPKDMEWIMIKKPMTLYAFYDLPDIISLTADRPLFSEKLPEEISEVKLDDYEIANSRLAKGNVDKLYESAIEITKSNNKKLIEIYGENIEMLRRISKMVGLLNPEEGRELEKICNSSEIALKTNEGQDDITNYIVSQFKSQRDFLKLI